MSSDSVQDVEFFETEEFRKFWKDVTSTLIEMMPPALPIDRELRTNFVKDSGKLISDLLALNSKQGQSGYQIQSVHLTPQELQVIFRH